MFRGGEVETQQATAFLRPWAESSLFCTVPAAETRKSEVGTGKVENFGQEKVDGRGRGRGWDGGVGGRDGKKKKKKGEGELTTATSVFQLDVLSHFSHLIQSY